MATCSYQSCGRVVVARTYCSKHYQQWKSGKPLQDYNRATNGDLAAWVQAHVTYAGTDCLRFPFPSLNEAGYGGLQIDGKRWMAHRYMCFLAHGEPPFPQALATHTCGKGHEACVNPRHLRWNSVKGNFLDRIEHGTVPLGEKNPSAKLTSEQVAEIKKRLASGDLCKAIAADFGVSRPTVSLIKSGATWGHVHVG